MIQKIFKICLFVFLAIFQITIMPHLAIYYAWPNLVLIISVLLLLFDDVWSAFYLAAIGGIVLDLTGNLPMGANTIFLICFIYLLKYVISKYFSETNFFTIFLLTFISSVVFDLYSFLLLYRPPSATIFIDSLYGSILASVIFAFYNQKSRQSIIKIGG